MYSAWGLEPKLVHNRSGVSFHYLICIANWVTIPHARSESVALTESKKFRTTDQCAIYFGLTPMVRSFPFSDARRPAVKVFSKLTSFLWLEMGLSPRLSIWSRYYKARMSLI